MKFLISVRAGHCDCWPRVPEKPSNATACTWRLHRSCQTGFRPNVLLLSRAVGHNIPCFCSYIPDPNVIKSIWAPLQQCETQTNCIQHKREKKNSFCEDLYSAMKTNALVRWTVHSVTAVLCQAPLQNEPGKARKYGIWLKKP